MQKPSIMLKLSMLNILQDIIWKKSANIVRLNAHNLHAIILDLTVKNE